MFIYRDPTEFLSPATDADRMALRRKHYLAHARAVAWAVWNKTKRPVTIDQVRSRVAMPDGVDPRINGSVFRNWTPVYTVNSRRWRCHHRPICGFLPPMSFLRRTFTLVYLAIAR